MQIIGRNSLSLLLMYQSEISQQKLCNRKENYSDNHVALRTAFAKYLPIKAYASFLFSKGLTECNINPHQLAHLYLNRLSNQGRRRRVNRSLACLLVTDCLWKI
ncbi:uncharacterized protein LOC121259309 isoform X3 [Juglans microcarpa x Juglans regia]|uniref:uncharacterized protein LOC121259309 isoform X3 n=2 Tax=Juglans microcarpa x Juglans regia TaxID=2249226 RepID=UPI001B7F02DC|nr:uncharacterized protein LOC121259309 isoform X3 [Juglans microcarpa x Juglans regia]